MTEQVIGIVGMGLMGSSLARALREYLPQVSVFATDKEEDHLVYNMKRGYITGRLDEKNIKELEVLFLAVPVRAVVNVIESLYPELNHEKTVITDMGSTKQWLKQWIANNYPRLKYVGGHPLTGREKSGPRAGLADLFVDQTYILIEENDQDRINGQKVRSILDCIGARILTARADRHDRILALTSHLPQILSTLLMINTGENLEYADLAAFSGGGFRDMTRIAGSDPRMWEDILLTNDNNIVEQLDIMIKKLQKCKTLITEDREGDIYSLIAEGRNYYRQFRGDDHGT